MSDPTSRRTLLFYRLTTVALLGVVAWLGIALQRAVDRVRATRVSVDAAAAQVAPSPTGFEVRSLARQLEGATGDAEYELFRTRFGSVRLVVLSPRQRVPLQFRRLNHAVLLPLVGRQEMTYARVEKGAVAVKILEPSLSTLLSVAPYAAHGWANLAATQGSATLVFSSAPDDAPVYVTPDDDRIAWGAAPDIFDARQLLAQLGKSGAPSVRHELPGMEGTIAAVAVSSEIGIEPRSGESAIWVVSGRGKAFGPSDRALTVDDFIIVPERTPLRIQAEAGAPLLLLDYQPDRLDVTSVVRTGKKLYSQFDEELLIRDFFRDRRGGTFLDVGAADYKSMSTTYYLEQKLGWSGLAVDALADYAKGYAEHRPRTRFLNYLVGDASSGPGTFYRAPRYPELSSASRSVAADQQRALRGVADVDELKVPTITLNDLLRQQGVGSIDFLSMDIEEHEPEALAGFDIQRYRPRLVCVEAHLAVADRIYGYFRRHGYTRIDKYLPFDSLNWYFTPAPPPSSAP